MPSNITGSASQVEGTYARTDIQSHDIITGGKVSGHAENKALSDGRMLFSVAVKNLADSLSGKLQTGNNAVSTSSETLNALQYVEAEGVTASNGQDTKTASASSAYANSNQPAAVTLYVNQTQINALAALG